MEGESGEQVGGELESVTSSAGCFVYFVSFQAQNSPFAQIFSTVVC